MRVDDTTTPKRLVIEDRCLRSRVLGFHRFAFPHTMAIRIQRPWKKRRWVAFVNYIMEHEFDDYEAERMNDRMMYIDDWGVLEVILKRDDWINAIYKVWSLGMCVMGERVYQIRGGIIVEDINRLGESV
jgi:hypothetical protein